MHWPSRAHIISFIDTVPDSGCKIQPPTCGQGRNIDTPMPPNNVLEILISKEAIRDTRLKTLALTMTLTYSIGPRGGGQLTHGSLYSTF